MQHCYHCTNNCTSHRAECFNKNECKGWYMYLTTSSSTWHAKGICVGIKFVDDESGEVIRYKHGDFGTYPSQTKIDADWRLQDLALEWQPMERPYVPTWKDKLRKFFLKKDYPKMVNVRPDDDTIVITKYSDDSHYEIVEYANRTWVTELSFPVKPSHWAYVPQKVVNLADSIIKEKEKEK